LSKASNETSYPKRRNDLTRKSFKTPEREAKAKQKDNKKRERGQTFIINLSKEGPQLL
jgi:hypothetical protein